MERKDYEVEKIELLLESRTQSLQNNFNDKDELNSLSIIDFFLDKYIYSIFDKEDFIIIKDTEERIEKHEYKKIVHYIIEGKIVLRDKKFIELLNILKTFKHYEDSRMNFIKKVKNLNVHDILDKIDKEYIKIYNDKYKSSKKNMIFQINLDEIGLPHLIVYNYLMTFERKNCSFIIENNELFILYQLNGHDYKIILNTENTSKNGVRINLDKKKIIIPEINIIYPEYFFKDEIVCLNYCSYPFYFGYYYLDNYFNKKENFKYVSIDIEKKYYENIFRYHGINFFDELSKKYKNYNFDIFYNFFKKEKKEDKDLSYIYLQIY